MHVVAVHDISDPATFWGAAQELKLPDGVALHSTIPNPGGTRAVCVWEADSVDIVKGIVEREVGHVSKNEYFPVDDSNAMGLPGATVAAAS